LAIRQERFQLLSPETMDSQNSHISSGYVTGRPNAPNNNNNNNGGTTTQQQRDTHLPRVNEVFQQASTALVQVFRHYSGLSLEGGAGKMSKKCFVQLAKDSHLIGGTMR
jgi:hypothetical protein